MASPTKSTGTVELRGEARDSNTCWFLWFHCQDILVENMDRLVAAHSLGYGSLVEIRGILRKERLRDEIDHPNNPELKERCIRARGVVRPRGRPSPDRAHAGALPLVHWGMGSDAGNGPGPAVRTVAYRSESGQLTFTTRPEEFAYRVDVR